MLRLMKLMSGNWKYLKTKLKNDGVEAVSATNQLKLRAPDGKVRFTDVLAAGGSCASG